MHLLSSFEVSHPDKGLVVANRALSLRGCEMEGVNSGECAVSFYSAARIMQFEDDSKQWLHVPAYANVDRL